MKSKPAKKTIRRKRRTPSLLSPVVIRRGRTTIRRYANRAFYRMEEVRGKTLEFVEFFTSRDGHSLDVRFQDKTALQFTIGPGFTLETELADWTTGNMRRLKQWPRMESSGLRE